ncbi:hypothetical protein T484DRAFT_3535676 [Baffinella frigidus]|nr:hypothetical protein T484DRAFT_3535676 [Cryptophyta sp. CCMP2293]
MAESGEVGLKRKRGVAAHPPGRNTPYEWAVRGFPKTGKIFLSRALTVDSVPRRTVLEHGLQGRKVALLPRRHGVVRLAVLRDAVRVRIEQRALEARALVHLPADGVAVPVHRQPHGARRPAGAQGTNEPLVAVLTLRPLRPTLAVPALGPHLANGPLEALPAGRTRRPREAGSARLTVHALRPGRALLAWGARLGLQNLDSGPVLAHAALHTVLDLQNRRLHLALIRFNRVLLLLEHRVRLLVVGVHLLRHELHLLLLLHALLADRHLERARADVDHVRAGRGGRPGERHGELERHGRASLLRLLVHLLRPRQPHLVLRRLRQHARLGA